MAAVCLRYHNRMHLRPWPALVGMNGVIPSEETVKPFFHIGNSKMKDGKRVAVFVMNTN